MATMPKFFTMKIVEIVQRQCGRRKITIHLFKVLKRAHQTA